MITKSFDEGLEEAKLEPIATFELAGQTFRCLPEAPAGVLTNLARAVGHDDQGNTVFSNLDVMAFLEGVLFEEDARAFRAVCNSKTKIISIDRLGGVMLWLSQDVYAPGRPTA